MQDLTTSLRNHAKAAHAQYPQYDGYYDSWTLGEITRRVRTKGGVDVAIGTLVLANFEHEDLDGEAVVSFYDPATTHNVLVSTDTIRPVEVTTLVRHRDGLVWFSA